MYVAKIQRNSFNRKKTFIKEFSMVVGTKHNIAELYG